MIAATVMFVVLSYGLMLAAYRWHTVRWFHVPVMASIMLCDLAMPVYLAATRDWKTRLIDHGDIWSFLVWMHFGLLITLFVLYALQLPSARRMLRGVADERAPHRAQGTGIMVARGLVIFTGALLAEPESPTPA